MQRPLEVVTDFLHDIVLGGCGQAQNWCRVLAMVLGDIPRDVAVVGPEVVAPFREAVRLVDYPRGDSASRDRCPERRVAKLLGGDQNDAGIAEADLSERVGAFRHRDEAVDGGGASDSLAPHRGDLIGHQCHERRDYHGKGAGRFVAHQSRELVAKGLAGPGRENPEDMSLGEVLLCNRPLQALAVMALRLVSEVREAEPAFQRFCGVKMFRTPGATLVTAVRFTEFLSEFARFEPFLDVGRNDGIASRCRQPRQQIGEREGIGERVVGDSSCLVWAPVFAEAMRDCRDRVFDKRGRVGSTNRLENLVEGVARDTPGKQRVPCQQ